MVIGFSWRASVCSEVQPLNRAGATLATRFWSAARIFSLLRLPKDSGNSWSHAIQIAISALSSISCHYSAEQQLCICTFLQLVAPTTCSHHEVAQYHPKGGIHTCR